jgi:hypothetical protein
MRNAMLTAALALAACSSDDTAAPESCDTMAAEVALLHGTCGMKTTNGLPPIAIDIPCPLGLAANCPADWPHECDAMGSNCTYGQAGGCTTQSGSDVCVFDEIMTRNGDQGLAIRTADLSACEFRMCDQ